MDASIHDEDLGPEPTPPPSSARSFDETTWLRDRPSAIARPLPDAASSAIGIRTAHGRVIVVPAPVAIIGVASLILAAGLAVFDPPAVSSAALDHRERSLIRWENADRARIESSLEKLEPQLRELRRVALAAGIVPVETTDCGIPDAEHLSAHLSEAAWLTGELLARTQGSAALDLLPWRSPIDLAAGWVITDGPTSPGVHVSSSMGTRSDPFTGQKKRHQGLDLSAPAGTPVTAPASGVVEFAGAVAANDDHSRALLGNHVMIKHGDSGYFTLYAHLEKVSVKAGQAVKAGDALGTVGNTGRSTAPHLHYQVMRGVGSSRENMDPLYFITDAVLMRNGHDVWYEPQSKPSKSAPSTSTAQVTP